jgi:pyruvate formate lyase activating enzyme
MLNVFNIQRYSLHDGEGIRTNIFFKGCPLNCLWCNNPESIDPAPSIMFDERLCNRFEDCIKAGNGNIKALNNKLIIDRERITDLTALMNVCPSKALRITGQVMTLDEIMAEIVKDIPFYNMSGGGVTLSGGEPFWQDKYLKELLTKIKRLGIHVAAETSLHVPWENLEKCLDLVDVFLADLKHLDAGKFLRFTGGNVTLVTENFRNLDSAGKEIIIRVPVIPSFNFSEPELRSIIDFAAGLLNAGEINFIPFHNLAREKYALLGKEYIFENYKPVEKEELAPYVDYAEKRGLSAKILN